MKNTAVFFDHFEIHVKDIQAYCKFLKKLFIGGRYKVISDSGTAMFISNDGICIEIKKRQVNELPVAAGVCNPCLRMERAERFIKDELGLKISKSIKNPDGFCYFFKDHEGVTWHIKEYLLRDRSVNW